MNIPAQDPRLKVQVYHDTDAARPEAGTAYMHCAQCLSEWKAGVGEARGTSPKEYARQQVATTADGLQVWCTRHEINITTLHLRAVLAWKGRE